jgi:hypothetical protein
VIIGSIPLQIILICRKKGDQADAAAEVSYMTYVSQAKYELLTGSPEVAIGYLDRAVALKPEDELPYVARSKCLNRFQFQNSRIQNLICF